ncbi:response regulator transcription factor [Facklamia sp. DSM 111018]|uniref:Response regulator transcription factor n=1 Tax=Facklamia lactis TaxID=2749967 RepID=A0ABS0LQR2_9LACT|nr:response regulator transcription factor [Facklamia lactis]MBG9980689.1 response regulator transcription factor [Facklamia lactis]MBG9986503.1 response regulator transcription factor [Facklamia lactis]
MKVLMIEDNESVCEMMGMFFEKEGFNSTFHGDGKEGFEAYQERPFEWDLVILDLNLPSMDGMTICRKIREISKETPIIMLTAQDSESDQVIGLEMGADDYVTKPFSPLTLLARMKALHRRAQVIPSEGVQEEEDKFNVKTATVKINTSTREAYYNGNLIDNLTPKEFDLFVMFAKHPKRVFSREQLLKSIWEDPFFGDERTVDAHIKKLRQKIEKYGPQLVQTVWGVGYKFEEQGE